jgi:hypothetical protein
MTLYVSRVGLCVRCVHHRVTGNRRGSQFHLCGLAASDARFRKYPRLPVLRCEGFENNEGLTDQGGDEESHD